MRLLPVPGTAALLPEQLHDPEEVFVAIRVLTLKIYHKFVTFARKIAIENLDFSRKFTLSGEF
jgi:hypothetical protein